nr:MAG TPA: hypothetical protein [Caudoviricetes sp.]
MERAIIIAVFASTGLWSFISMLVQRYMERKSDYDGKSNNNRGFCKHGALEFYQYASAEIHGA